MDRVRLGLIGLSNIGSVHLKNIEALDKVRLVAVCDVVPQKAQEVGERYGCRAYTDSSELLRDRVCDAVLIATPHYSHTTIGIAALKSGHHVLVEKPISVHKADCERLIEAHQDASLVFAAMLSQRTDPHYRKIKDMVEGGELGRLLRINWIITNWFRTEAYYASGDRLKLQSFIRDTLHWTFWPSLAATVVLLALGKPLLWLFGPQFVVGYDIMFIAAIGLVAGRMAAVITTGLAVVRVMWRK